MGCNSNRHLFGPIAGYIPISYHILSLVCHSVWVFIKISLSRTCAKLQLHDNLVNQCTLKLVLCTSEILSSSIMQLTPALLPHCIIR